jgi:hypothetical protein
VVKDRTCGATPGTHRPKNFATRSTPSRCRNASWVAIITVVRETSERRASGPVAFLMSDYDGFIGWMVLGWTFVIGWALWWWYRPRP